MVVISPGKFVYGVAGPRTGPEVKAKTNISTPFAVGRFVVTLAQFEAFVSETSYSSGDKCRIFENGNDEE
jgi:formylglycine-generating enzyme required for sulfatase activity